MSNQPPTDEADAPADEQLSRRAVTMNQVVAFNIAYFRKARGLTQEDLGKRLERITGKKWSKATMSAVERSWDGPRVRLFDADDLFSFANALDYPVPALFLPPPEDGVEIEYAFSCAGPRHAHRGPKSEGTGENVLDLLFISEDDSKYVEDEAYTQRLEDAFNFYYGGVPDYGVYARGRPDYIDDHQKRQEQIYTLRRQIATLREIMGGMERAARDIEGVEASASEEKARELKLWFEEHGGGQPVPPEAAQELRALLSEQGEDEGSE